MDGRGRFLAGKVRPCGCGARVRGILEETSAQIGVSRGLGLKDGRGARHTRGKEEREKGGAAVRPPLSR